MTLCVLFNLRFDRQVEESLRREAAHTAALAGEMGFCDVEMAIDSYGRMIFVPAAGAAVGAETQRSGDTSGAIRKKHFLICFLPVFFGADAMDYVDVQDFAIRSTCVT